jgi:nitrate reductase gamma subunit
MEIVSLTQIFAYIGIAIGLVGVGLRVQQIRQRPFKPDLSRPRGSAGRGVLYAFTLGMAPWEKESTRKHWVAYLRGIFFHLGTFAAYAVVFLAPFRETLLPPARWLLLALTLAGTVFGFTGILMRYLGKNERVLSTPDDYFAVFLTALFGALAFAALLTASVLPAFYLVTALLSVYVPFGKIRHCIYFFYSKFFFGKSFGHRGVLGPDNQKAIR